MPRPMMKPIMKPSMGPISIRPQFSLSNMQNFRRAIPPPKRKVVRDRFYDRSRDIPNDVYFGDVKGKACLNFYLWQGFTKIYLFFSSPSHTAHKMGIRCFWFVLVRFVGWSCSLRKICDNDAKYSTGWKYDDEVEKVRNLLQLSTVII
jgi:hypothetical protein